VCDLELAAKGAPSIFILIREAATFARRWPTFDLSCEENALDCASRTPEAAKKRSVS